MVTISHIWLVKFKLIKATSKLKINSSVTLDTFQDSKVAWNYWLSLLDSSDVEHLFSQGSQKFPSSLCTPESVIKA